MAINDLELRAENGLYSILAINAWVNKYHPLNELLSGLHKQMYLETIGKSEIRLPPMDLEPSSEMRFLEVYEKLNRLVQLHQLETYCKKQNKVFEHIKGHQTKLKEWMKLNASLYKDELFTFHIDYLDYSANAIDLQVPTSFSKIGDISVDRKWFHNSIQFIKNCSNQINE